METVLLSKYFLRMEATTMTRTLSRVFDVGGEGSEVDAKGVEKEKKDIEKLRVKHSGGKAKACDGQKIWPLPNDWEWMI